jgi:creatinine amidohydrolase
MTWREVEQASKDRRTVLVPIGTVETQGRHTAIGFEYIVPERLALAAAEKTNAVVTPVIPFGWSADFEDYPGTISLRPETLTQLYEDVLRSILSHGFDHILVLATHIPNQQFIEQAAYRLRRELGVTIIWINPGQLANKVLQDVSPAFAKAKGHGADPGISLGEYLSPGSTDRSDMAPNETASDFLGFPLTGMAPSYNGFPVNAPLLLQDVAPRSSGAGDPTIGTVDQGKAIFEAMVEHVVGLVREFAKADTRTRPARTPR